MAEPNPEPLVFLPWCDRCERPIARVSVDDALGPHPWQEAAAWCYLAQLEHDRAEHPEVT
jgi:hypothetical protein